MFQSQIELKVPWICCAFSQYGFSIIFSLYLKTFPFHCLTNSYSSLKTHSFREPPRKKINTLMFSTFASLRSIPILFCFPFSFYSYFYHNSLIYYNYLLTYLSLSSRKGDICLSPLNTQHSGFKVFCSINDYHLNSNSATSWLHELRQVNFFKPQYHHL